MADSDRAAREPKRSAARAELFWNTVDVTTAPEVRSRWGVGAAAIKVDGLAAVEAVGRREVELEYVVTRGLVRLRPMSLSCGGRGPTAQHLPASRNLVSRITEVRVCTNTRHRKTPTCLPNRASGEPCCLWEPGTRGSTLVSAQPFPRPGSAWPVLADTAHSPVIDCAMGAFLRRT